MLPAILGYRSLTLLLFMQLQKLFSYSGQVQECHFSGANNAFAFVTLASPQVSLFPCPSGLYCFEDPFCSLYLLHRIARSRKGKTRIVLLLGDLPEAVRAL